MELYVQEAGFLGIRHDMTEIRHVATGICRYPLRYTKIAPMAHCAMGAIWAVMHVYNSSVDFFEGAFFCLYSFILFRNAVWVQLAKFPFERSGGHYETGCIDRTRSFG